VKTAVVGANGQLGVDVSSAFRSQGHEVFELTHADVEIADVDSVLRVFRVLKPDFVVNTAAMHHVERCEENPAAAFAVNAIGARNLARMADDIGTTLIHISTDYVFKGDARRPYVETDLASPLNVYGNSKLAGEYFVSLAKRHFIIRTSGLYGTSPCRAKGRNFIQLMLKLSRERPEVRVVDSERLTPTWTTELARQLVRISGTDAYGLYHATAEESCTWYQFAKAIFSITGCTTALVVADPDEFVGKVPRPAYSVLENARLKENRLNVFQHWQEGLRQYLTVSS
jgi:dTDP-4-dehydrorhamnose reductase